MINFLGKIFSGIFNSEGIWKSQEEKQTVFKFLGS